MQDIDKEPAAITEAVRVLRPGGRLVIADFRATDVTVNGTGSHGAWLRAKAEGENIRRRAQEDIAKAGKFAAEKFAGEMLAVKDSLEAALASPNQDAEALKGGVELTLKQLIAAFERSNVTEINPLEDKFDPHKHQAISQLEADGEPNRVINVLQKGYALHERILRPALVIVAKAKVSDGGTPAA